MQLILIIKSKEKMEHYKVMVPNRIVSRRHKEVRIRKKKIQLFKIVFGPWPLPMRCECDVNVMMW